MRGVVARLVPEEGFGFIRTDDDREFFFHRNALNATDFDELAVGSAVEFKAKDREEGDRPDEHLRAVYVHLAPEQQPAVDNEPVPAEKMG